MIDRFALLVIIFPKDTIGLVTSARKLSGQVSQNFIETRRLVYTYNYRDTKPYSCMHETIKIRLRVHFP